MAGHSRWLLVATLLLAGAIRAEDQPAPAPPRDPTPEEAAGAVLAAFEAKDAEAMTALARKDEPDPWIVADELIGRRAFDAAAAFASAAPRTDVERLPAYVAAQRTMTGDNTVRLRARQVETALREGRLDEAMALTEALPALPADIVGCKLAYGRALALKRLGRQDAACEAFASLAEGCQRLGCVRQEANAWHQAGIAALRADAPVRALPLLERCRGIQEKRGDRRGLMSVLHNLAATREGLGEAEQSLACEEQSLRLAEDLRDPAGIAAALNRIGTLVADRGEEDRAIASFERAAELYRRIGNAGGEAVAMGRLSAVHAARDDLTRSIPLAERCLALYRSAGNADGEAAALNNLASMHSRRGDHALAIACQSEALRIHEARSDAEAVATSLVNLGSFEMAIGEYGKALEHQERGLAMLERSDNRAAIALALGNLGNTLGAIGAPDRARECHERSLAIYRQLDLPRDLARTLGNLANCLRSADEIGAARELHQSALAIREQLDDRLGVAASLASLANLHHEIGETDLALACARRARSILEGLGDEDGATKILATIGLFLADAGDVSRGLSALEEARQRAAEGGYLNTEVSVLVNIASMKREHGEPSGALEAARHATGKLPRLISGLGMGLAQAAREEWVGAFELGALAAADLGDATQAAWFLESGRAGALLEAFALRDALAERALPPPLRKAELDARAEEVRCARALGRARERGDAAATKRAQREQEEAQRGIDLVVERIQRAAAGAANVTYPRADEIASIQARLAPDEALVLYGVLSGEALALVATASEARLVELPPAAGIAAACAALRPEDVRADPGPALSALRKLVIDPLRLPSTLRRILISPDADLCFVPFTLLLPVYEVVCEPSGTVHGLLLRARAEAGAGVLALGDPDYRSAPPALLRSGRPLRRLPASREEAEGVGTVTLLGKEATEPRLAAEIAKRARWRSVHLACHGLADTEFPQRSALALTPDGASDGMLTVLDIFRMSIPSDLVVLSACETGRGKVVRGEGLIGLARAFMHAGAPRVIVSLWKVDDEATRALMVEFYKGWNAGRPAIAALREAQAHVRAQPQWAHPHYWAAWVLWGLPE